jgi:hypothetical protein
MGWRRPLYGEYRAVRAHDGTETHFITLLSGALESAAPKDEEAVAVHPNGVYNKDTSLLHL